MFACTTSFSAQAWWAVGDDVIYAGSSKIQLVGASDEVRMQRILFAGGFFL